MPDTPVIYKMSPTSGGKGTIVTITGTGFSTDTSRIKIMVNDRILSITACTDTSVSFLIPVFSPAPKDPLQVALFIDGKQVGNISDFKYHYKTILVSVTNGLVGFEDGPVETAKLEEILSLTIDSSDNIYTTQWQMPRVRKIGANGMVSTMAGDGTWGYLDGNGTTARLGSFDFCASDDLGNIYVAENNNTTGTQYLRKIDTQKNVTTFATFPQNEAPYGIKRGKSGTFYYHSTKRIGKITPDGQVTLLAYSVGPGRGDKDGVFGEAKFHLYGGIDVSEDETRIYVGDNSYSNDIGGKVKVFDLTTNTITTIAGNTSLSSGDGDALNAGFRLITCVMLDKQGGLYIADGRNDAIKYLINGQVTTVVGKAGSGDLDGELSLAKLDYPHGLAINSKGEIFISCVNNNKLKKITTE